MTYEETLEKIHSFNVFGSRLGLERMKKLLSLLGNPQEDLRIIHVAGTNGKGSVCRFLYTVLTEAGYRTGAYFSPYLQRFTERIECGGKEISPEELTDCAAQAFEAAEQMVQEGFESPTEFELVTAIGLLHFQQKKADFVILEVGLGGRGDSTNICPHPQATAITSISRDHMDRLGDTLEAIAWDKAGILKKGAPAMVFVEDPGAFAVIRGEAEKVGALLTDLTRSWITIHESGPRGTCFSVTLPPAAGQEQSRAAAIADNGSQALPPAAEQERGRTFEKVRISMAGRHQVNNAVCALSIAAVLQERGIAISEEAVYRGMERAVQPGRFEILSEKPTVILDGAHNIAGVTSLTETVRQFFPGKKILLCTGMLADKEYTKMAQKLAELDADLITVTVPNPRSLSASALADVFRQLPPYAAGRCGITSVDSWEEAVSQMQQRSRDYDVILWAGSLYLIGGVRGILTGEGK